MIVSSSRELKEGSVLIITISLLFFLLSALYLIKESTIHKYQTAILIEGYYQPRIMEELFLQEYEAELQKKEIGTKGKVTYSIGSIEYEVRKDFLYYRIHTIDPPKFEPKKRMRN